MASNVIEALAAVMDELPPIEKGGRASQQQGGYAYRGIEQITAVAAPLLAKHSVVFVPQVLGVETRELTVNGKPWTDTILTVRYRICGPGGPDDAVEATVVGIGRDNSDKGANKALTQAFKYALTQTLCIGDSKDDNDGTHDEADARPSGPPPGSKQAADDLAARVANMPDDLRATFKAWKDDQGFPYPWPQTAIDAMHAEIDRIASAGGEPDPAGPDAPPDSPPAGEKGYPEWSRDDLIAECKERGLPHSGTKDRLVDELRAWDAINRPGAIEYSERPF